MASESLTVYPRWRGEHCSSCSITIKAGGLSPLARGTHFRRLQNARVRRFIPAGAGNTLLAFASSTLNSVYPRWRGEHAALRVHNLRVHGLSPLARGTHPHRWAVDIKIRFIPAGAGNTSPVLFWSSGLTVYPRWRGEHAASTNTAASVFGLSPLARGTPQCQRLFSRRSRFIPAGAGNTVGLA